MKQNKQLGEIIKSISFSKIFNSNGFEITIPNKTATRIRGNAIKN